MHITQQQPAATNTGESMATRHYATPHGSSKTLVEYDVTGVSGTHSWSDPADEPAPLPSLAWLQATQEALHGSVAVRRLLRAERGIRSGTAKQYGVGYARNSLTPQGEWCPLPCWVLPVYAPAGSESDLSPRERIYRDRPELVNVCFRPVGRVRKPWRLAGRLLANGCLPLWPGVPEKGPLLLLAGEFDVLAARQAGISGAITGLLGCRWYPTWNPEIVGRRVATLYDRGEEQSAADTVNAHRRAGAEETWSASWAMDNENHAKGYDLEKFLRDGHSAQDVFALLRQCRPRP